MLRVKQTCHRAPPHDPYICRLVTRGRIGIVEEAAQPLDDRESGAGQAETSMVKPMDDRDVESLDNESEIEEVVPVKWRQYRTCFIFLNSSPGLQGTWKETEKALRQRLARGGTIGNATLLIRPKGHDFSRPTCPLPTSKGKGKVAARNLDDSLFEDDDMASRLRVLAGEPLGGASGHPKAKVARTTRSSDVVGSSLPPLSPGFALAGQLMIIDPPLWKTPPPLRPSGKGAQKSSHKACSTTGQNDSRAVERDDI
uniref:Uncharacterized protein n=1 Tax=Cannabis sativa TaxID=3483 RepID=A0A803PI28_CANSA